MARIAPKFFGGGDSVLILKTKILAQKFSPAETPPPPPGDGCTPKQCLRVAIVVANPHIHTVNGESHPVPQNTAALHQLATGLSCPDF